VNDFFRTVPAPAGGDGIERGVVSLLGVRSVLGKPELFSTFLMWLLAELFEQLPEVGDIDKPKLVFLFVEAHLLFADASKAFMSNYLQGLRYRFAKLRLPVVVTEVQPGFVDTAMAKAAKKFWAATPEKAARQIFAAVRKRKRLVYVTRRWRLVAWLVKAMPDWLAQRLAGR